MSTHDDRVEELRQKILDTPPDPNWCGHFSIGPDGFCFSCARQEEIRAIREAAWDEGHLSLCRRHGVANFTACRNPYAAAEEADQ